MATVTVFDVAKYILVKRGDMSAMKLQKLIYYSQAWSLVWDDVPLFDNRIEAWANGPVSPDLYSRHRGQYGVSAWDFRADATGTLSEKQIETIDAVLEAYGGKSAQWLSDQTHAELPWKKARVGLLDSDRSNSPITYESMAEYYGSL
ncbi:Panacea domain-containing protein [Endozoicomonas sp.]|uniref:Panacea domain-containing protein n=1 Tax=Endozoicomonas sp. TaxID=1892382 RepID=UPI0028876338|nr:DUF4065 domain-containing protein [Endozoicomonas sp.]